LRNAFKNAIRKPEGNRPLWVHRHTWWGNIKMYLKEVVYVIGYEDGR
jgi:hypothetical protein